MLSLTIFAAAASAAAQAAPAEPAFAHRPENVAVPKRHSAPAGSVSGASKGRQSFKD